MNLWILSQNRDMLLQVNMVERCGCFIVACVDKGENNIEIGEYDTAERAEEVFKTICSLLVPKFIANKVPDDDVMCELFARENAGKVMPRQFCDVETLQMGSMLFEMPTE